jgi:hypothetical protein
MAAATVKVNATCDCGAGGSVPMPLKWDERLGLMTLERHEWEHEGEWYVSFETRYGETSLVVKCPNCAGKW